VDGQTVHEMINVLDENENGLSSETMCAIYTSQPNYAGSKHTFSHDHRCD